MTRVFSPILGISIIWMCNWFWVNRKNVILFLTYSLPPFLPLLLSPPPPSSSLSPSSLLPPFSLPPSSTYPVGLTSTMIQTPTLLTTPSMASTGRQNLTMNSQPVQTYSSPPIFPASAASLQWYTKTYTHTHTCTLKTITVHQRTPSLLIMWLYIFFMSNSLLLLLIGSLICVRFSCNHVLRFDFLFSKCLFIYCHNCLS